MTENNKLSISNISYFQNILKIKPSKKNIQKQITTNKKSEKRKKEVIKCH